MMILKNTKNLEFFFVEIQHERVPFFILEYNNSE